MENQRRSDSSTSSSPISALDPTGLGGTPLTDGQLAILSPAAHLVDLSPSPGGQPSSQHPSPSLLLPAIMGGSQQATPVSCSPSDGPNSPGGEISTILQLTNVRQARDSPHGIQLDSVLDPVVGAQSDTLNPVINSGNCNRPLRLNGDNNTLIRNLVEPIEDTGTIICSPLTCTAYNCDKHAN